MEPNQKKPAFNREGTTASRMHHFDNELIISSLDGLVKRFGLKILDFSLDESEVWELVKASDRVQGTLENNYFWTNEVLKEVRHRIRDGSIPWPLPEYEKTAAISR
jgi:hypothetical protein